MERVHLPLIYAFFLVLYAAFIQTAYDGLRNTLRIIGTNIVPENSNINLQCLDTRNETGLNASSITWQYSFRIAKPVWSNCTSCKVTETTFERIQVSQNDSGLYRCCLQNNSEICATTAVFVIYADHSRQIISTNLTHGYLKVKNEPTVGLKFSLAFYFNSKSDVSLALNSKTNIPFCEYFGVKTHDCHKANTTFPNNISCTERSYSVPEPKMSQSEGFRMSVQSPYGTVEYHLDILIHGKPILKMQNFTASRTDKNVTLWCRGMAYPAPAFTFSYTPCADRNWEKCLKQNASIQLVNTLTHLPNDSVKVEAATTLSKALMENSSIIQCTANNSEGSTTIIAYAVIDPYSAPEYTQFIQVTMYGISGALIFTIIVWFAALSCRKTSEPQWIEIHDLQSNEIFSVPPEFDYRLKNITMGKKIAEGTFGEILLAKATNILCNDRLTEVAVKKLKATTSEVDLQAMISEAHVMFQMGQHLNLVNLLGVVTQGITNNEFMIVVEYCRHGSLHQYLNKYRTKFVDCWEDLQHPWVRSVRNVFKTIDLVSWAAQVANGMAHLASLSIVHGDLSTRHVLLHDGNVVKISDFTLARKVHHAVSYSRSSSADMNMLNLEREAEQMFSVSSDIWAYGVYLWNLFNLEAPPALEMAEDYYMHEKPAHTNEEMYGIIKQCWERSPAMTPSFDELASHLNSMLPLELQSHLIVMNHPYEQANYRWKQKRESAKKSDSK